MRRGLWSRSQISIIRRSLSRSKRRLQSYLLWSPYAASYHLQWRPYARSNCSWLRPQIQRHPRINLWFKRLRLISSLEMANRLLTRSGQTLKRGRKKTQVWLYYNKSWSSRLQTIWKLLSKTWCIQIWTQEVIPTNPLGPCLKGHWWVDSRIRRSRARISSVSRTATSTWKRNLSSRRCRKINKI